VEVPVVTKPPRLELVKKRWYIENQVFTCAALGSSTGCMPWLMCSHTRCAGDE
jgi:hypothetical protein